MRPVLILGGPTGSGKNRAALDTASRYPCEIVNADSRQIYRGLNIGTNQPTREEFNSAPHHLFGFLDPGTPFSMADYAREAFPVVEGILSRNRIPIVVGGTGFYVRALLKGVWPAPRHLPEFRDRLRKTEASRPGRLHAILKRIDPASAAAIPPQDGYRVLRSIEIYFQSGRRRSELDSAAPDRFPAAKFFLDPGAAQLEASIRERTERMLREGWLEEVQRLLSEYPGFEQLPAARSIGYREVIACVQGLLSHELCRDAVIRKTLQYAKRQRTWFRNQDAFVRVTSSSELRQMIDSVLQ